MILKREKGIAREIKKIIDSFLEAVLKPSVNQIRRPFSMRFCLLDEVAYAEGAIGASATSERSRKGPEDGDSGF